MADWFINSDNGDNSTGDGSSGSPWETLAYAYTQASDGDTIYVQAADATYAWANLTPTNGITLSGVSGDPTDAIFDGGDGGTVHWKLQSDWTFENVTFRNAQHSRDWDGMWEIMNDSNLVFTNCIVHDILNAAGQDIDGLTGVIQFEYEDDTAKTLTLTNCLFYDIRSFNANPSNRSIIGSGSAGASTTITGCTFDLSVYDGNQLAMFSDNKAAGSNVITATQSIFYSDTESFAFGDSTDGSSYSHNCYYNVTDKGGTGSTTSDPLFIDAANSNYKLRPTSPCVGTGGA